MPYAQRLAQLRTALLTSEDTEGPFDCFLVPRVDRYQGEYVQPADERLAWLTGFTGSAGLALILPTKAALFVDGRYTLQAKQQVSHYSYTIISQSQQSPQSFVEDYLKQTNYKSLKIAYDPWLHTPIQLKKWEEICQKFHCTLHPLTPNPIDKLWYDRPAYSLNPIEIHDENFTGKSFLEKITQIKKEMSLRNVQASIITSPASLCWLLNIRGTDFPFTPLFDGLAILHDKGAIELFVNPCKITNEVKKYFSDTVTVHSGEELKSSLHKLKGKKVAIDPNQTPVWIVNALKEAICCHSQDFCLLPKALKNDREIEGFKQAHLRDGVALTRFFSWLSKAWHHKENSGINEISASQKLEEFRRQGEYYKGPSFETISAFESNGAIVHYHSSPQSCKKIDDSSLYLLDSGGQYLDGTTDVTRTICLGEPTEKQKHHFTLVLKGHIDLAMAKFPKGTTGAQLDAIARFPLWQEGLDYDHGTGHGVGYFLSVHEGPQSISKAPNGTPLKPGMIISNEPGYYKEGKYGIRIENLVLVKQAEGPFERPSLCFETLTLVPLDRKLIDVDMLSAAEWEWLNAYHQMVREKLLPYLDPDTAAWLVDATEEL